MVSCNAPRDSRKLGCLDRLQARKASSVKRKKKRRQFISSFFFDSSGLLSALATDCSRVSIKGGALLVAKVGTMLERCRTLNLATLYVCRNRRFAIRLPYGGCFFFFFFFIRSQEGFRPEAKVGLTDLRQKKNLAFIFFP